MALSAWKPTDRKVPSPSNRGESNTSVIHTAVGRALSQWEHFESGLARFFQLLCETRSFAACRAYGTVESSYAKMVFLREAMEVFIARREPFDPQYQADMRALFTAYQVAQQYRNNIAHGMAVAFFLSDGSHSGYFLCPPSHATKKVEKLDAREIYLLGASYWYNAEDIDHYGARFAEMLGETMRLIQEINTKYAVLKPSELHP